MLVHANGNRGRLAVPKALDQVIAAYPTELSYVHKVKLRISDQVVDRTIRETERAALMIVRYLNTQSTQAVRPTGDGSN